MRTVRVGSLLVAVLLAIVLAACSGEGAGSSSATPSPTMLRFGVPPDEADPASSEDLRPVADQLAQATGTKVQLVRTTDYLTIIAALRANKLDLALIGPMPTVIAQRDGGVQPLVAVEGAPVRSTIICSPASGIRALAQLKGHSIAFVDPGSTSGNYVPRLMLKRANVDPETLKVTYAGGHDAAVLSVKQGSTDCAANSSMLLPLMLKSGTITAKDYRVVAQSDPLPINVVVLARTGLSPTIATQVTNTLVTTQSPQLLKVVGATRVVAADQADWSLFRDAAQELHLLLGDLR